MSILEIPSFQEVDEVSIIAHKVQALGDRLGTMCLNWWYTEDAFALIETSGSRLLVESNGTESHAATTELTESIARVDYDGAPYPGIIFRRQGNPDSSIAIGERLNILGLPRRGRAFDEDYTFTTGAVTGIQLLVGLKR